MWKTERPCRKGNYLHGSFIKLPEVDGYVSSVNPGDNRDVLGNFPYATAGVDLAVESARAALPRWHRMPIGNRRVLLERYADALLSMREALVAMIVREVGKPYWEAESEVEATVNRVELVIQEGLPLVETYRLPEKDSVSEYHPWGVSAILAPYNLPLLTPNVHIIPALIMGNTVVYKPSRYTPAVGQLIAEAADRAKLPRGVFNMVQGRGKDVGERLVSHPDVSAVHLDGTTSTVKKVRRTLLDMPWKHLVLNGCARSTAVVLDDAELDKAVYEVMVGAFMTTGQRRNSTTRVIVTAGIADRFIQRLVAATGNLRIGYGFERDVFLGPLNTKRSRRNFLEFLQGSVNSGMDLLTPSYPVEYERPGFYVHPAILYGSTEHLNREITAEDALGPVLEVFVVKDFAEAAAIHNLGRTGMVTALFSRNADYLHEARYLLRTGILNFNRSTVSISARMPFQPVGDGNGSAGGLYAIRSCAHTLTISQDRRPFDAAALTLPGIFWPADPGEPPADDDGDEEETTLSAYLDSEVTVEIPRAELSSDGRSTGQSRPANIKDLADGGEGGPQG